MDKNGTNNMYFVAIVCPKEINDKVLALKNWMKEKFGCVVALKSPAHITLIPPFWYHKEKELLQSLASFKTEIIAPVICLKDFSHFGKKALFISVEKNAELQKIQKEIVTHFMDSFPGHIKKEERAFQPHVTIANRDIKPSDFYTAWSHFSEKHFDEQFQGDKISLLKLQEGKWVIIENILLNS
jgi:2'-5' RNA ligase